jgi:mono/diheme cytochrome c family protein
MTSPAARALSWLALQSVLALAVAGCRTDQTIVTPDPHLERMLEQEKRRAYEPDPDLPHGMAMQHPPAGTLPVDAIVGSPLLTAGTAGGRWADRIPVPLTRDDLEVGRDQFDTFCAPCHGVLGTGDSVVADKMALRKPPDLHEPDIVSMPPGQLYDTIRNGYGLMPGYAVQLSVKDAWDVAGYVQALQLARAAKVAELPKDVQDRLAREAP